MPNKFIETLTKQADSLLDQGNLTAADDSFFDAYIMLGAITGPLGQTDKCEMYKANMNLANALQQNQKAKDSIPCYQHAIEPGNPPPLAYCMPGRAHAIIGGNGKAEESYRQFITVQSDNAGDWLALNVILQQSNKADETRTALDGTRHPAQPQSNTGTGKLKAPTG